ncbi:MAG: ABC transporter substrate-binding protein [Candidatus Dormibacteraceae bacterium]
MNETTPDPASLSWLLRQGLSRRSFLRGSAAALAASGVSGVLLEACGSTTANGSGGGTPKKGGHITEGWVSDIKTFNSMLSQDVYSNLCIGLINDGLLTVDAKGNLMPLLATAVPSGGADGNTYTFTLHKGVKWTDGTPLTSDDVLFTYNLIFAPQYAAVASPRRGAFTQYVESISAPDPQTFVIKTKQTYAPLLVNFATFGIMPKHVLQSVAPAAINTMSYNSAPTVTNGMFKFVSWEQGAQVVLARNESYYGGPPLLDKWVYKVEASQDTIGDQLKTGEIDVGGGVDPAQVASLKSVQGLNMINFVIPAFGYVALQLDPTKPAGKLLQDEKLRQALFFAINRPGLIKSVEYGFATEANSVEPPTVFGYNPNTKPTYPYDTKKSNQLLDQLGWVKGSDGIRSKNGVRLAFTMIGTAGSATTTNSIQVIQENFKAVGCQLTPQAVQFPQLVTALTDTHDFDMILLGFNFANDPDQSQLFASSGTGVGGFNGMDFKNAKVDSLLSQGVSTLNKTKRKEIYFQYQDAMAQELPIYVLYFQQLIFGVNQRVQGMDLNTFQHYTRPWMNKVWVSGS